MVKIGLLFLLLAMSTASSFSSEDNSTDTKESVDSLVVTTTHEKLEIGELIFNGIISTLRRIFSDSPSPLMKIRRRRPVGSNGEEVKGKEAGEGKLIPFVPGTGSFIGFGPSGTTGLSSIFSDSPYSITFGWSSIWIFALGVLLLALAPIGIVAIVLGSIAIAKKKKYSYDEYDTYEEVPSGYDDYNVGYSAARKLEEAAAKYE